MSTPPKLNIPRSSKTVSVSIIDTTSFLNVPINLFVSPPIPDFEVLHACAFSFLIEHRDNDDKPPRRVLFDLGVRSDWATGISPAQSKGAEHMMAIRTSKGEPIVSVNVDKDVHTILKEGGVDPDSVEAVVWSHAHLDHTGNPALFGPGTALVVGPGFGTGTCGCGAHDASDSAGDHSGEPLQPHIFPGYPADPESILLETDYAGRELRALTAAAFDQQALTIGGLRAFDYFGDGSFYLLDTPGHAPGHLCGLARVVSDDALPNGGQFILMGGDAFHHMAELRPSPYKPLPAAVPSSGLDTAGLLPYLPDGRGQSFWVPGGSVGATAHLDADGATATVRKLQAFDADANVLVVAAHDTHLYAALVAAGDALFPQTANDFAARGLVDQTQWTFLDDFSYLLKGGEEGTTAA